MRQKKPLCEHEVKYIRNGTMSESRVLEFISPKEAESYPAESSSAARAAAQPSDTKWWPCMSTLHSLTI